MRVRRTYLELTSPGGLKPVRQVPQDVILLRAGIPSPELNRYLYSAVGGDWHWTDRLGWTYAEWKQWLDRAEVETWVLYKAGTPAGYFELEVQGTSVEISYFGLLPAFVGHGLGSYLLTQAAHRAFQLRPGIQRVWLHTCTLDHPAAVKNYLSRGFLVFKEEEFDHPDAAPTPGPWPGAERPL